MTVSRARLLRQLYPYKHPSTSVDHLVVGGGVVGLSVAAALVNQTGRDRTTFVVERRGQLGQETTARNSEVIHSGIYREFEVATVYRWARPALQQMPAPSDWVQEYWEVATAKDQVPYLHKLQAHSAHSSFLSDPSDNTSSRIQAEFLSGDEARNLEPDLSSKVCAALHIPSTGIVDSQGLVDSLELEVEDPDYNSSPSGERRGEGVIVKGTRVVRIDREEKGEGWVVQMETGWEDLGEGEKGEVESVRAGVVINAAGLNSVSLCEGVVPEDEMVQLWPVKGNYMSYKGPGIGKVSRLIYPCPSANVDHLGTHLTLDLDGHVRFGPDVQTIGTAADAKANPDFWQSHLAAIDTPEAISLFARSVSDYLSIDPSGLSPDYSGIRPNIAPPGAGFSDFLIRHGEDRKGFVELLGFNSPGLTSSLAVGEYVAKMISRDVYRNKSE
ncbi:hypothetical protein B9479_004952 [Cryptococcus floricola]|uniref:L-2-hydroxyglutarate dehydrogenase, mitochondrial n=1 Tax=Cryptococcus floricola TaxID=2591691 RepID=A0A5D3AUP7_9TREE|nr:hypothetical protein B9479_004952 [Cryptococcus floricola]